MEAYALDKDFNLVTYGIPFDNLQWNRKYYDFGNFMMQLPLSKYESSWAFIGIKGRDELGMVQKFVDQGRDTVLISGFFCEKLLDRRVCYPRYVGSATTTEQAVRNIFTKFIDDLPVSLGAPNNPMLGDSTQSDFTDDQLGTKLYSILEAVGLSYRVRYDYSQNELLFEVWQGKDRTQDQDVNSTQTFSADFGNIGEREINRDQSDYKNYAIVPYDDDGFGNTKELVLDLRTDDEEKRVIVIDMRSTHPGDRESDSAFDSSVKQSATEKLLNYAKVEDINIEILSDKGYMRDYDLGDLCDVIFRDSDLQLQARIIEVNEVFKKEGHEITVGLGNKRISRIRRAVLNR